MSSSHLPKKNQSPTPSSCCLKSEKADLKALAFSNRDWSLFFKDILFLSTSFVMILSCLSYLFFQFEQSEDFISSPFFRFISSSVYLMKKMGWGLILAIFFVGILGQIPREFIMAVLEGKKGGKGIVRAALLGVFFDVCNHGVLIIGMKLYERGASLAQVVAFLIASPWNSISLTIVLISLIGLKWTLFFIFFSVIVAILSGYIFDFLVNKKVLPSSPFSKSLPENFSFFKEAKKRWKMRQRKKYGVLFKKILLQGIYESKLILKWLFLGIILASLISAFLGESFLKTYFGASFIGLGLTLVASTIIEVCSEGSTPIASELVNKASAPGNAFVFLMAGASTDYTEIMILKEKTQSWKIAFFLPMVTVPQILMIGLALNTWGS